MIISLRRPVFHTALALSAGLPLCQRDVMCLIFTGSPLTCCSGGDAHPTCHVAAEAASQSSNRSEHTYATEYKNNKINKPQANCDSLTTSSGIILEQTWRINAAVYTRLKTTCGTTSYLAAWQDLTSVTAWDGHLMINEACHAMWIMNDD